MKLGRGYVREYRVDVGGRRWEMVEWDNHLTLYRLYMKLSINFLKGKEIMPLLASWITLLNIILSEMSQWEKNKYCNVFT